MRSLFLVVWVVVSSLQAACGGCGDDDGTGRLPDAPRPPTDTSIDVPLAPITLTVTRNGAPAPDVRVYFQNADDSLVLSAVTNNSGVATAVMVAGGYVTALEPGESGLDDTRIHTFAGVKPGDHLLLTDTDTEDGVDVTVILPDVPNATRYEVRTSCGFGTIFVPQPALRALVQDIITLEKCATADVMVIAHALVRDGESEVERPVSALYHPGVALTGDAPSIDLSEDEFQAVSDVTFTYTNGPSNASDASVDVRHWLVSARGPLGAPFVNQNQGFFDDGNAMLTVSETTGTGLTSIVDTTIRLRGLHHVVSWGALADAYTIDLTGLLLPDLVSRSASPSFNPTTRRVSWTEETTGATPDLTVINMFVRRFNGKSSENWRWDIAAPYTAGETTVPQLPTEVADFGPLIDDDVDIDALANAKVPGGYDAVRARIHDLREPGDVTGFAEGPTGRVVLVEFGSFDAFGKRRPGRFTPRAR